MDQNYPEPCFPTPRIRSPDSELEQNDPKTGVFSPQNPCKPLQICGFRLSGRRPAPPPWDSAFCLIAFPPCWRPVDPVWVLCGWRLVTSPLRFAFVSSLALPRFRLDPSLNPPRLPSLALPCRPSRSPAPFRLPPNRLARHNHVRLCRNAFFPIHLLPGLDKDALAGWRLGELTLLCLAQPSCLAVTIGRHIHTTHANAQYDTLNIQEWVCQPESCGMWHRRPACGFRRSPAANQKLRIKN
jgi:hypothetical protein